MHYLSKQLLLDIWNIETGTDNIKLLERLKLEYWHTEVKQSNDKSNTDSDNDNDMWDPLRTRAIPERLRGVVTTRRYTNPRLPLPLPYDNIHFRHIGAPVT